MVERADTPEDGRTDECSCTNSTSKQRETSIMGSSVQLDYGLEEHMPIIAIEARAHLIGLVLFVFWGV